MKHYRITDKKKFIRGIILMSIIVSLLISGIIILSQKSCDTPEIITPIPTMAPITTPEPTIEPTFEILTTSTHEHQFIKLEGKFLLTAYCACEKCCYEWANKRPIDDNGEEIVYTSTGAIAKVERTVAVDPEVIPYGTILLINGHYYVAEDCSDNWVHGNHIDIYMGNHEEAHQEAINFGEQYAEVYIYNTSDLSD